MELIIDVVGSCDLKCPSCPVGNSPHVKNNQGVMTPDKLREILEKATREGTVDFVALYNWTEPLIHPRLPELVRTVKSFGIPCHLSSHLNTLKNEDELMAAEPDHFRISMSGFTQENYGITHRGGEVSKVLENLKRLADARTRTGAKTEICILYHRYLGNLDDELKLRKLASKLDIAINPVWAYLMPLEKMLAFAYNDSSYSPMTEEDQGILKRLALPFDQAIEIAQRNRKQPCSLIDNQVVMNARGEVILCCTIYDQDKYKLGNFLDRPLKDITRDKHQQQNCKNLCETCMAKGAHVYSVYGSSEFNKSAEQNVLKHYSSALEMNSRGSLFYFIATHLPAVRSSARFIRRYLKKFLRV